MRSVTVLIANLCRLPNPEGLPNLDSCSPPQIQNADKHFVDMSNTNTSTNTSTLIQTRLDQFVRDPAACARLRGLATNRLARLKANGALVHMDPDDLLQEAFYQVCRQIADSQQGWRPRAEQLVDMDSFERWLGVLVAGLTANAIRADVTRSWRGEGWEPAAAPDVVAQVQARSEWERLLLRLREHYSGNPEWLGRIEQWCRHPAWAFPGEPHQAHALRQKVRALLTVEGPDLA